MKRELRYTRLFCFLAPMLMDGLLGLVQTTIPFLAISLGANSLFLGTLGSVPQLLRVPVCLLSGQWSDKFGRIRMIILSACITLLACILFALVGTKYQVLVIYTLLMVAVGTFYPSLQAFIGDRSRRGDLRKNLSAFNAGWTTGGAILASLSGYLYAFNHRLPFISSAVISILVILLMILWSRRSRAVADSETGESQVAESGQSANPLLFVARMGHFLGFFGFAMMRNLFPQLGLSLKFDTGTVGLIIGTMLVGQATGMIVVGISDWWRDKLWPLMLSQAAMLLAGLVIFTASSRNVLAIAMIIYGSN